MKKIVLLSIIILTIFLTGCSMGVEKGYKDEQEKSSQDTSISDCDKIKDTEFDSAGRKLKDICYLNEAKINNDISFCEKIESRNEKNDCYWEIALKQNSPDYCSKVKDEEYCYVGYASKLAQMPGGEDGIDVCKMIISDKELRNFCCYSISEKGTDVEKNNECLR